MKVISVEFSSTAKSEMSRPAAVAGGAMHAWSLRGRQAHLLVLAGVCLFFLAGCKEKAPAVPPQQPMPVMVAPVSFNSVPSGDTFVATIKSRRSATLQPQVDGNLTKINVVSGQAVKAGQVLMQIDPLKQVATVDQQVSAQAQSNASYQFEKGEVERQKKLFDAGITSRQAYDTAVQNFASSQAAYNASAAGTNTQRQQLAYYQIRAPFSGIVGDIPVHLGDYVTPTTMLTTLDENSGLEAYIYIPTEQASLVKMGLPVQILDTSGHVLAQSTISFLSPQVDNGIQGILAKAEVPSSSNLRNQQVVNARVIWNSTPKPTVPVLAVTQIGGQSFVYVAKSAGKGYTAHLVPVSVGDPVGNNYPVLSGLNVGDKVILSGLQFLGEGSPVNPMTGPPAAPPAA
jgi:RND family efflux transporter MFP subunit